MRTLKPTGPPVVKTIGPETPLEAPIALTIEDLVQEDIDGAPRLVLYMSEPGSPITGGYRMFLTRELADTLVKVLGPHPLITEFFKLN